ncbi:MAG TPA: hypothetical protein EYP98_00970 [Planctomycetes bacterium]|nr:hypothetical protein [Planctomycetota bacterium]
MQITAITAGTETSGLLIMARRSALAAMDSAEIAMSPAGHGMRNSGQTVLYGVMSGYLVFQNVATMSAAVSVMVSSFWRLAGDSWMATAVN